MAALQVGEIWTLRVDNEFRRVRVVAPAGIAGWWRCIDLETDIFFLGRGYQFVERQLQARPTVGQ